jgi:ferritin-like metal-binding protein YciE
MTTPYELLLRGLGTILYSEEQLAVTGLPELISQVDDEELRSILEDHLAQTHKHIENIERVFELLGESAAPRVCLAYEGLIEKHRKVNEQTSAQLTDLVTLAAAIRTEAYELASYSMLRRLAKALGEEDAVVLLDANHTQAKEAHHSLERAATRLSKHRHAVEPV